MNRLIHTLALIALLLVAPLARAELKVLACEPEWGALVKELAGDKVSVYVATTALQDPHRIEARPSLVAAARNAGLVVCTGAELEVGWLPLLIRQSGNSAIQPGKPGQIGQRQQAATHIGQAQHPGLGAGHRGVILEVQHFSDFAQRADELQAGQPEGHPRPAFAFFVALDALFAKAGPLGQPQQLDKASCGHDAIQRSAVD